jgi:hypothetical protein
MPRPSASSSSLLVLVALKPRTAFCGRPCDTGIFSSDKLKRLVDATGTSSSQQNDLTQATHERQTNRSFCLFDCLTINPNKDSQEPGHGHVGPCGPGNGPQAVRPHDLRVLIFKNWNVTAKNLPKFVGIKCVRGSHLDIDRLKTPRMPFGHCNSCTSWP